jgi:hypothetical protein
MVRGNDFATGKLQTSVTFVLTRISQKKHTWWIVEIAYVGLWHWY